MICGGRNLKETSRKIKDFSDNTFGRPDYNEVV